MRSLRGLIAICSIAYGSVAVYHAGEMLSAVLVFVVGLLVWPTIPVLILALTVVALVFSGPDFVDVMMYSAGQTIIAALSLSVLGATIVAWRSGHRRQAGWLKSVAVFGWFIQAYFWSYLASQMHMYGID